MIPVSAAAARRQRAPARRRASAGHRATAGQRADQQACLSTPSLGFGSGLLLIYDGRWAQPFIFCLSFCFFSSFLLCVLKDQENQNTPIKRFDIYVYTTTLAKQKDHTDGILNFLLFLSQLETTFMTTSTQQTRRHLLLST